MCIVTFYVITLCIWMLICFSFLICLILLLMLVLDSGANGVSPVVKSARRRLPARSKTEGVFGGSCTESFEIGNRSANFSVGRNTLSNRFFLFRVQIRKSYITVSRYPTCYLLPYLSTIFILIYHVRVYRNEIKNYVCRTLAILMFDGV